MEANLRAAARSESAEAADLEAVSETLRGNREAFRSIVERHGALILRLAASFLRDPDEADEASQEIFFKAFRSLRSFKLEKAFQPWLYTLAVNYLRTRYRRKRRQDDRRAPTPPRDIPAEEGWTDPASVAEAAESRELLEKAIGQLPPAVRDVVSLYYAGGLSVSQISGSLGISSENVKSRLFRGRKRIREYLQQDATTDSAGAYSSMGRGGKEPA
jgi:RNA polymerase sigma-70 factor, ECF subfamily